MASVYTRHTTRGGRTVTVVSDLPGLQTGYQCDGCFTDRTAAQDVTAADRKGRSHASTCTSTRAHRPAYWGLV